MSFLKLETLFYVHVKGVHAGQDPFTPRRTTRSVSTAAPRKSKASVAEAVLLKTLGLTEEYLSFPDSALRLLKEVFDSPIHDRQLRAIAAVFGNSIPMDWDALDGDTLPGMV